MRVVLTCVAVAACTRHEPLVGAPPPPAASTGPQRFALIDAPGHTERVGPWSQPANFDDEDVGTFAYAQRRTSLTRDGVTIGWLEPGARVGVPAVKGDSALVTLFAWHSEGGFGSLLAVAPIADLGPVPPRDQPRSTPAKPTKLVMDGQRFRRADGATMGFTFCGPAEILDDDGHGAHVRQREDGVVIEGKLDADANWQDGRCPGDAIGEDGRHRRILLRHHHLRGHAPPAIPGDLRAAGPFTGVSFAELARRHATIYWLDRDPRPACSAWELRPDPNGYEGTLAHSERDPATGETFTTRFGVSFTDDTQAQITLTGPTSEAFAANGSPTSSVSLGCGEVYKIVANDGGAMTMLVGGSSLVVNVIAYDPRDTTRWYTERARCEHDALVRTVSSLHGPC